MEALKDFTSKRLIPLVGAALKAINLMHCQRPTGLFHSCSEEGCNGNSCSATVNKWLKQYSNGAVAHSLGIVFEIDYVVKVQPDLIDQVGGWSNKTMGSNYGEGYNLRICLNAFSF